MHKPIALISSAILFAIVLIAANAQAYEAFNLDPVLPSITGAEAEATVRDLDTEPMQKEFEIYAWGLEPNSVYTVWFVGEEPEREMQGVGVRNYSFETDGSGNGRFVTHIIDSELAEYENIEIAYHADRDPRNVDDAVVALKGEIKP